MHTRITILLLALALICYFAFNKKVSPSTVRPPHSTAVAQVTPIDPTPPPDVHIDNTSTDEPIQDWSETEISRLFGRVGESGFEISAIAQLEYKLTRDQFQGISNIMNAALTEELERINLIPRELLQTKITDSEIIYTIPGDANQSQDKLFKLLQEIDSIFGGKMPTSFKEKLIRSLELSSSYRMLGKYKVIVTFTIPKGEEGITIDETAYDEKSRLWGYSESQGKKDIPLRYSKLFQSVTLP